MTTTRKAEATWNGSLLEGSGTIDRVGSGAFAPLPVSWPSRSEEPAGKTSPEELIAAAWAACFSMAFANGLAQAGNPPERLSTSVSVTFVPGTGITRGEIAVRGSVPGVDENGFREAADEAKQNCPVSKALAGIPDVSVAATLE